MLIHDPVIREAILPGLRTLVNAEIVVAGIIPPIGIALDVVADSLKMIQIASHSAGIELTALDVTPDVDLQTALTSDIAGLLTGGLIPSHLAEANLQRQHDLPIITSAAIRALDLWRGKRLEEPQLYAQNRVRINAAIQRFGVQIPSLASLREAPTNG